MKRSQRGIERRIAAPFHWALYLGALCLAGLLLPVSIAQGQASSEASSRVLAEVNSVPITEAAVQDQVRAYLLQIGHRALSAPRMAELEQQMLKKLIEEELLFQEGQRQGLALEAEEIEEGVRRIRSRFSSETDYEKALAKAALDRNAVKEGVARALIIRKTWQHFAKQTEFDRKQRLRLLAEKARIRITTTEAEENVFNPQ